MKELLLIRHGKSSWNSPGLSDHDRPLNDRGRRDAPNMAAALMQRGARPDLIVSSTADRAQSTAKLIAAGCGYDESAIELVESLYLASSPTILSVVQQLDEASSRAFLFGHNPGMHDAADRFAGDAGVNGFPTLAVARLEFSVDYWGEVEWGEGLLVDSFSPKTLSRG